MTPKKSSETSKNSQHGNYAIVESSGTQFWLEPNRYYDLDRIKADVNEVITLEKILLLNNDQGVILGKPYVENARVELKVLGHRRGPKIIVYKMRRKKKTRSKNGHRQELTRVMVQSISIGNKASKSKSTQQSVSKQTEGSSLEKSSPNKTEKSSKAKTSGQTKGPSGAKKAPKAKATTKVNKAPQGSEK